MQNNPNHLELLITLTNKPKALGYIHLYLSKINAKLVDMDFINSGNDLDPEKELKNDEIIHLRIIIKLPSGCSINEITEGLLNINGISSVDRL